MKVSRKIHPRKPKGQYYRGYYRPMRVESNDGYHFLYVSRFSDRTLWTYQSKDGRIKKRGRFDNAGKGITTFSNVPNDVSSSVSKTDDSVREEKG